MTESGFFRSLLRIHLQRPKQMKLHSGCISVCLYVFVPQANVSADEVPYNRFGLEGEIYRAIGCAGMASDDLRYKFHNRYFVVRIDENSMTCSSVRRLMEKCENNIKNKKKPRQNNKKMNIIPPYLENIKINPFYYTYDAAID